MAFCRTPALRSLNHARQQWLHHLNPRFNGPRLPAKFHDIEPLGFASRGFVSCCGASVGGEFTKNAMLRCSVISVSELVAQMSGSRSKSSAVPVGARKVALKVTLLSPGIVFDQYKPRERISFWKRWFTLDGWRRTKEDLKKEMMSAYAISRLRKVAGYTKKLFYQRALVLHKEINILLANGDVSSLRKHVTEKMHSTLKNEIKRRESMWSSVYWELVEPVVSIRTLQARMIALDKDDLNKAFIQLTVEIVTKQKFEAYNSKGGIVSGDKTKVMLVRDVWVFERSLFHPGADWRLCARLTI